MTIPLTGAGGLFTKIGHHCGAALDILVSQGSALAAPDISVTQVTKASTIVGDYAAGTAEKNIVDGLYAQLTAYQNVSGYVQYLLGTLAPATLIDMANVDTPLAQKTVPFAMALLVQQMQGVASVNASSVALGAQTNVATPTGNPIIVMSAKRGDGLTQEYAFTETITFKITADSQTGGATANQETCSISGKTAASNVLAQDWPNGSGVSGLTTQLIDATVNASGGTLLQNGGQEVFSNGTTGAPADNWVALVGAAQMLRSTTAYSGTYSMQFTGDSATLTSMAQPFNTTPGTGLGTGGTASKVLPDVPYPINLFYKLSAGAPAAGVLEVSIVDGTNTIINDDQGTANSFNVNLNGVADTNWHSLNGFVRFPKALPATQKLRIRLSTALTTGTNLFIDHIAMGGVSGSTGGLVIYPGGPFVGIFSGSTKVLLNDSWTISVTNTRGIFQREFDRLFSMRTLGLQLPSSGSPTINDNLVA